MHKPIADLLILVAVLLPPRALDLLGELTAERTLVTPYGEVGPLGLRTPPGGPAIWVQPYSGTPSRTDPRATLYAARALGVHYVLNWDTGVAINPLLQRGQTLLAVDFIDWTRHQPTTFGDQLDPTAVGNQVAPPTFCPHMLGALWQVVPQLLGAVYLGTDGPRRETPAEARIFRQFGADIVGQNLVPEVYLARELGLCYAGLVTVGERSADQLSAPPHGELRAGLEQIMRALPAYVNLLGALPTCNCAKAP